MPTLFYIAAYAAIFLSVKHKIASFIMLLYMAALYSCEALPDSIYSFYYILTSAADIACVVALLSLVRYHSLSLSLSFLAMTSIVNSIYGYFLYQSYSEPDNYNLIGESIIILQILMTWTLRNGRFQPINSTVFRFRSRIRL